MEKFNSLFEKNKTKVKLYGDETWYLVIDIADNKKLITLLGVIGKFQKGHVRVATNKNIKHFTNGETHDKS